MQFFHNLRFSKRDVFIWSFSLRITNDIVPVFLRYQLWPSTSSKRTQFGSSNKKTVPIMFRWITQTNGIWTVAIEAMKNKLWTVSKSKCYHSGPMVILPLTMTFLAKHCTGLRMSKLLCCIRTLREKSRSQKLLIINVA